MSGQSKPASAVLASPVWGKEYIRLFCETVVPNLLGHLPALAGRMPCTYHVYTDDEQRFRSAAIDRLGTIVDLQFHSIYDLADENKYNTMTAAYNDAIKRASITDSALIFLNADMVYSWGSFEQLVNLIDRGKRCVEIEGFRVNKPPVEKWLRQRPSIISDELVALAIKNVHPISLCHFWEPETDTGFIPFHTYWRTQYGLVARASHLYPLYLYPRDWNGLAAAQTIDWDLTDKAGLHPYEMHIVCDSEEIFSVELSDPDYAIDPSFPYGAGISDMRKFVDKHCTSAHRKRLSHLIRFRVGTGQGGNLAELKSELWYRAVCDRSGRSAAVLLALSLPSLLSSTSIKLMRRSISDWAETKLDNLVWLTRVVASKYRYRGFSGVLRGLARQIYGRSWILQMIREKYERDGVIGVIHGIGRRLLRQN